MAAAATLVSMAQERKVENLRAFMMNLANSRGFSIPETKFFEQKFFDLCLSRTPDHPTYSAMIFIAITELNKEGDSCGEEVISEFIKSKYKNLPYAHTSLLSHHLAKLVEKKEILCDYNNNDNYYCYSLPGDEKEKKTVASTDTERKSLVITLRTNGHRKEVDKLAVNEAMTRQNEQEDVIILKSGDLLEQQRSLTESRTSPKRIACGGINVVEVRHTEDNGVDACLMDSAVETLGKEGVAEEPELALESSVIEGRIEANSEGGELYEVIVLDEQNDVVMGVSGKGAEKLMDINSEQRKAKLRRTSTMMKEACVEVKSEAYKTLWECQTEACGNIIALEKLLTQCRKKGQQKKAVSEVDDVSRLPLSMKSCIELRKFAQKIESKLSKIIDSFDEPAVPNNESRGCNIECISKGLVHKGPKKRKTTCDSEQLEEKESQIGSQKKPQAKKTRVKRLIDIEKTVLRKSPRGHKPI